MSTTLMTAHNQWASRPDDERFQTLDALHNAVHSRRMVSRSADVPLSDFHAEKQGDTILLSRGSGYLEPSHWSFGQLATQIKAPAAYLRTLPLELAVENINHGLKKSADVGELKFMSVSRADAPARLQALTSTTYGRIWDADVVAAAKRIVDKSGGRFYNPKAYGKGQWGAEPVPSGLYASDRDVFIFMIDGGSVMDIGPRAKFSRGFFLSNSEVGRGKFTLTTFLLNHVCLNHMIWGATDIRELSIIHRSGAPTRFDNEALPGLLQYVEASAKPEESAIRRANDYMLPVEDDGKLVEWVRSHGKFSKEEITEAIAFAKREEGDCRTLFQLIQGGTAYARGFDWIDAKVDVETRFSALMDIVKN